MNADEPTYENLMLELRRGVISLAVLNLLRSEQYGYSVLRALSEQGLDVDQGTLYPLLRRLEGQGLLESSWRVEEGRPRRYYQVSPQGRAVLPRLNADWCALVATLDRLSAQDA
jgi:DNA-binding PadR family transcriptional regulator